MPPPWGVSVQMAGTSGVTGKRLGSTLGLHAGRSGGGQLPAPPGSPEFTATVPGGGGGGGQRAQTRGSGDLAGAGEEVIARGRAVLQQNCPFSGKRG